jgi:Tfp pilus assembly protein PilF
VAKLEHPSLSMAGLRQTEFFLRELRMTGKVRRKKSEAGSLVFWLNLITVFTFALLLLCTTLLVGCKSQNVTGTGEVRTVPAEQRKADLLKTLDRKFENPQAHYELGQVYLSERQWLKAEYHFSRAISFDPAHCEAQAAMVKVFIESGDTAKSKTYADIYMNQAAGSASVSFRLGFAFQKQLIDEYAFDSYMQALQLAPTSAKVHKQLGYYYLSKNDKVRAEEYLKRSFQFDPGQPEVAGELGRLGVEVRIPGKAVRNPRKVNRVAEEKEVYKWSGRAGP